MQASPPKTMFLGLCLIFGLSLILRWDGPVDQRRGIHFWLSAQTLQTLEIWDDKGLMTYGGNPIETYPQLCNMHQPVPGHTFLADSLGQYYYTSYPPLGLLLPYGLHQGLGIKASVISLRILSLLLYALSLFFLFLLLWRLSPNYWTLLGTAAFAFSPGPLYYLSHIYFSDMLALFWLIMLLWAIQRQVQGQNMWFWLALLNFCACYTEWLGMLFALVAGIWLSRTQKSSRWFWCFGISGLAALVLCIWQYSQIDGLEALLAQWFGRLNTQSGADISIWQGLGHGFLLNQIRNYGIIVLAIGGLLASSLFQRTLPTRWPLVFWLALIAPFAHQLLFLQFGYLHDFAGLKGGAFWVILLVYLGQNLKLPLRGTLIPLIIGAALLLLFGTYRYHRYVEVSNPDIALGERLHHELTQQEAAAKVYFIDIEPSPVLHYYAKHNFAHWQGRAQADSLLEIINCESAILIRTQEPPNLNFQPINP